VPKTCTKPCPWKIVAEFHQLFEATQSLFQKEKIVVDKIQKSTDCELTIVREDPAPAKAHGPTEFYIPPFELARSLNRLNRRFAFFLQAEMTTLGITEIGASLAMILIAIGEDEVSVGRLSERLDYGTTNMSYYLKQLATARFIERQKSPGDKRAARVRLSEKGRKLCADLAHIDALFHRFLDKNPDDLNNLAMTFLVLHRMDQARISSSTTRTSDPTWFSVSISQPNICDSPLEAWLTR
jgi:DNA-binding MarR family transcriptional regulator